VAEEDQEKAQRTLLGACVKLTPQVWYNQKVTAASHFWDDRGVRVRKEDIVGRNPNPEYSMTPEEYMSVSKMSMRFYIASKLPLHFLELSIAFSGYPRLGRAASTRMGGAG
jgi:hypothetical protein